jgi:hypothetical protein
LIAHGERRRLGERGLAFVREKYSKKRLLADVAKLYDHLLSSQTVSLTGKTSNRALPGPE